MDCAPGSILNRHGKGFALWRWAKKRKPAARFASGGGWKLFSSLLAVSPLAGSANSLHSRSRGGRHEQRARNSLRGDGFCLHETSVPCWFSEKKVHFC